MNFTEIKANVSLNLNDAGIFFEPNDLAVSMQDAYDDICSKSQCILKSVTLNWQDELSYYDFVALGVPDFIGTVAIYDNNTNRFLFDDLNLKQFEAVDCDWELRHGTPQNWAALNFKFTAIMPKPATASGTFILYYWAAAPIIVDSASPLIALDAQTLLELYVTADLFEQAEEYTKAGNYWEEYFEGLEEYTQRVKRLVKSDLLTKI